MSMDKEIEMLIVLVLLFTFTISKYPKNHYLSSLVMIFIVWFGIGVITITEEGLFCIALMLYSVIANVFVIESNVLAEKERTK